MATIYTDCILPHLTAPERPTATAFAVTGDTISWVGQASDIAGHLSTADDVVGLSGSLVLPGFVDAHAHISQTGASLRCIDLGACESAAEALALLKASPIAGSILQAPNWDETRWSDRTLFTRFDLDQAVGERHVYCPRVDGHSAIVSSALAAASDAIGLPGWQESGLVTLDAARAVRAYVESHADAAERDRDIDAALNHAASLGICSLHENGGPTLSSAADFAAVLAAGERPDRPATVGYWAEAVTSPDHAQDLIATHHAHGLAGDLNIDGSIGSHTAALRAPYADADHAGHSYLDPEAIATHVQACTLAGTQAGYHVIGDAGSDAAIAGFSLAAERLGRERLVAARHRLEHLEMIDDGGIHALASMGIAASVQPAFDAAWGSEAGMYVARLGTERAAAMNAFGAMIRAGMIVAFGSDAPVTPLDPWGGIRAAVHHHQPSQRIDVQAAILAHSVGGRRAALEPDGLLRVGAPATFAAWGCALSAETSLPTMEPGHPDPVCQLTVRDGHAIFQP